MPTTYEPGGFLKRAKVSFAYDSALFNAEALTDSANLWTQPANSVLIGVSMILDVAFIGVNPAAITDMDVTIGDAGDNDGLMVKAMNLTSDALGSTYKTKGAYWDATAGTLLKEAATTWVGYSTAAGANLSTLTAGQVSFEFTYIQY